MISRNVPKDLLGVRRSGFHPTRELVPKGRAGRNGLGGREPENERRYAPKRPVIHQD